MKINTTPENPVQLGGIVGVSEFKIRNSAKAFSILSSGLYSNKIRAILREIGCNAVDSHVAAGKADVPFDLHLPTQLAPYFSIRDYGTGLSHDQVVNIYTTYFESTKTESNDYIGALGLGSKSPFSYTDNFTVTAIQNGVKGVYSAFINEAGVPSVALMTSTATDEPNGVEVQFAVEKERDIHEFKNEARTVYRYFKVKPNLTGAPVDLKGVEYYTNVTLPGAALRTNDRGIARAVMGNIAYPIRFDTSDSGMIPWLLSAASIDFFFEIGDVEFAASRESLSYNKPTIAAIEKRAHEVLDSLETVVQEKMATVTNVWERAVLARELGSVDLLTTATRNFMQKNKDLFPLHNWTGGNHLSGVTLRLKEIAEKFNVSVRAFESTGYGSSSREIPPNYDYNTPEKTFLQFEGLTGYCKELLLINEANTAIIEHVKYHLRTARRDDSTWRFFVVQAADKTKPMDLTGFMDSIHNPMADMIFNPANLLKKPPKVQTVKRVDVLRSEWEARKEEVVWRASAQALADLDPTQTYYYVTLKGFEASDSKGNALNIKSTHKRLLVSGLPGFEFLYGVRKADLPTVEKMKNWVPVDVGVAAALTGITPEQFFEMSVKKIDRRGVFRYVKKYENTISATSPIHELLNMMDQPENKGELGELCKAFAPNIDPAALEAVALDQVMKMASRYPMLLMIQPRYVQEEIATVADYINLIDKTQKVN